MYSRDAIIENEIGLHARPASMFATAAAKFKAEIRVSTDSKKANGKSILSILTLGASHGDKITISAEGADEREAVSALYDLVKSRFGEGQCLKRMK